MCRFAVPTRRALRRRRIRVDGDGLDHRVAAGGVGVAALVTGLLLPSSTGSATPPNGAVVSARASGRIVPQVGAGWAGLSGWF